jgi:hypothetical protein
METYSTGQIREELAAMSPNGVICHQTWQTWRTASGIRGNRATREQWIKLCACFALHRMRRGVSDLTIQVFVRQNGDDPMAFIPGLLPIDAPNRLPGSCFGRDLADVIAGWVGIHPPSESTVRRWVLDAGLRYSVAIEYSMREIVLIVRECVMAKQRRARVAMKNLQGKAA